MTKPQHKKDRANDWTIDTDKQQCLHRPSGLVYSVQKRPHRLSRADAAKLEAEGIKGLREFSSPDATQPLGVQVWLITAPAKDFRNVYDSFPSEADANIKLNALSRDVEQRWLNQLNMQKMHGTR